MPATPPLVGVVLVDVAALSLTLSDGGPVLPATAPLAAVPAAAVRGTTSGRRGELTDMVAAD